MSDERLHARRVRIRCRLCGHAFAVDATKGGTVYAAAPDAATPAKPEAPTATAKAAPLTGERNETSVLFSLASLASVASVAKATPPAAPSVTESSTLVDLRALCATTTGEVAASHADEIATLSGGAFSPLLAPPFVSLASPDGAEGDRPRVERRSSFSLGALGALGALGTLGMAVLAVFGATAFARARHAARSSETGAPTPRIASSSSSGAALPPASAHATVSSAATATSESAAASTSPAAPTTAIALATRPPSTTVTAAQGRAHGADARLTATAVTPPAASTKCCAGEDETSCQMRLAVGAACVGSPSAATTAAAPPFDRAAAIRALGVSVESCKHDDGPTGPGHVKVTFQPTGSASAVEVDMPYADTEVGACVAQRFRTVTIPAFAGRPLTLGKSFVLR